MAGLSKASIDAVSTKIKTPMEDAEGALNTLLGAITDGGDVTTAQLLKIQSAMAKYTLTASIFSAITKELSDSLKQTASKIG
jgi:Type III secretion needle MxiH, YscF, SsaG, EprI, PscF, EscF